MPRSSAPDKTPTAAIWLGAAAAAVFLHAAAIGYVWFGTEPIDDEAALGVPAVEIGLELAAPPMENANLPPGPESEDAAASTPVVEQTAKTEDVDLPKETPTETDDPDRVVAPDAAKVAKDESPVVPEVKAVETAESVASEATAPPVNEAVREAAASVAPVHGSGENPQLIRTTWQKHLVAHLNRFKRYPRRAQRRTAQIVVAFTLDRMGHVVATSLQQGSGDPAFDLAALEMMKRADPVPAPPPVVADQGLTFALPVNFHDRNR